MKRCLIIFAQLIAFTPLKSQQLKELDLLTRQWPASWIAHPTAPLKTYAVFHFRRSFDLDAKPSTFLIHITADNRYRLFVNGQPVGLGPARGDKLHWVYDSYDLASFLQPGKNTVGVLVWNMGDVAPIAQMSIQSGLLVQGNSEKESAVNTGLQNWKVMRGDAYKPFPVTSQMLRFAYYAAGACDSVNGNSYPWGWEQTTFDDNNWQTAKITRAAKPAYYRFGYGEGDGNLVARKIPYIEESVQRLSRVVRSEGAVVNNNFLRGSSPFIIPPNTKATVLFDNGFLTTAYPELMVSVGKDASINVSYAEALFDEQGKKGNRNQTENKKLLGYHDAFITDGGVRRIFRPLWFRTYRYMQLEIQTGNEALTIEDLYGNFSAYPFLQQASFTSSEPQLAKIWDVAWRTARLCANETYFDCPYYEQLQYVGDTRIQALISLHVAGDDRLVRNALTLYDYSRLPEGITQSRYPTDYAQMIPPFSLYWVNMVHDYFMYREDTGFVKQFLPGIGGVLNWFGNHLNQKKLLANLGWWNFVDWAPQYQRGVPAGAEDDRGSSVLTLQYIAALDDAADLFSYFKRTGEARLYKSQADDLRASVRRYCYDKTRQLFTDAPDKSFYSQHANVMAILTNSVPEKEQVELMRKVLSDTSLIQCTIYYKFYLMRALRKVGMGNQYLNLLDPWNQMLQEGLTTFAEKNGDTRSDCHAWSSSPMIEFLQTVCGIEPASPGFRTVKIIPHLGRLTEVNGQMPHPKGMITVKLHTSQPGVVEGEVTLPEGLSGSFGWNGKIIKLLAGTTKIKFPNPPAKLTKR